MFLLLIPVQYLALHLTQQSNRLLSLLLSHQRNLVLNQVLNQLHNHHHIHHLNLPGNQVVNLQHIHLHNPVHCRPPNHRRNQQRILQDNRCLHQQLNQAHNHQCNQYLALHLTTKSATSAIKPAYRSTSVCFPKSCVNTKCRFPSSA